MGNIAKITFNKGRLTPKVDPRVDWEGYDGGCRELDNMIPTQYGVAERRPGTEFIASTTSSAVITGSLVSYENADVCYENNAVAIALDIGEDQIICFENDIVCNDNEIVMTTSDFTFISSALCYENVVVFYENDIVL